MGAKAININIMTWLKIKLSLLSLIVLQTVDAQKGRLYFMELTENSLLAIPPTFHGCQITSWVPWPAVIWN